MTDHESLLVRHRELFGENQPTWARVRHGAGCGLPRRVQDPETQEWVIGELPPAVPVRLDFEGHDAEGNTVWRVRDRDWSPGDTVEIGPLPANTLVRYEIAQHPQSYGVIVRFAEGVPA